MVRESRTDSLGLVLVSGIIDPLMEATIRHPRYLANRVPALLASPGTFAFRRVRLEAGSVARAQVIFLGRERRGAACEVLQYEQKPTGKAGKPQRIFSGSTNGEGVCQTDPLPAGVYILRVSIPGSSAHAEVGFDHAAGQETHLTVELLASTVSGKVTLGKETAAGFQVELHSNSAVIPSRTATEATASAHTDEEGRYEVTVWSPGEHYALATTPTGIPAAGKQIELEPGENVLDFELDGAGISGLAVDESGNAIEGAGIVVRWRGESGQGSRVGRSGSDGMFYFPMLDSGHVVVEGKAKGFRSPPPAEVEFVAGPLGSPWNCGPLGRSSGFVKIKEKGIPLPKQILVRTLAVPAFLKRPAVPKGAMDCPVDALLAPGATLSLKPGRPVG